MTDHRIDSTTDEELIAGFRKAVADYDEGATCALTFRDTVTALADRLEGRGGGEEPVAWRIRQLHRTLNGPITGWSFTEVEPSLPSIHRWEVQPLYAREGEGWREAEGWKLVPTKALPAMLERAAFNLCAEYGVEFVKPLGKFVEDAYEELVSAAPAPPSQGG